MSSQDKRWNGAIILLLAVAGGCQMGAPLDRNVQISQHLGGNEPSGQPPRTRLASSTAAGSSSRSEGQPAHHRLSDSDPEAAMGSPVATQEPTSMVLSDQPAQQDSLAVTAEAQPETGGPVDIDFSALIAAFRDSPPEVQQQAIRQLIAAASPHASRTAQPGDISEQLKISLDALPALPEDFPDAERMPVRLAASAGPAPAEESRKTSPVSQAVAASTQPQPDVTPVSGTLSSQATRASGGAQRTPPPWSETRSRERVEKTNLETAADTALYEELMARLATPQAGESDSQRFRRELIRRHLQVLAGDADAAVQSLAEQPEAEQKFLRHHLMALHSMIDADGHPVASRRFAAALPQFRSATRHLSEATEQLDVRSLAFCTEILSFGQVKRFASNRFAAGQKVILYCEIDNFIAEKVSDGYETELQGSYEIFDDEGTKVASQLLPSDRQICDHHLRDYFIAYQMHLPSQLEPGNYRLELSMECVKGRKYGQASLPLVIK